MFLRWIEYPISGLYFGKPINRLINNNNWYYKNKPRNKLSGMARFFQKHLFIQFFICAIISETQPSPDFSLTHSHSLLLSLSLTLSYSLSLAERLPLPPQFFEGKQQPHSHPKSPSQGEPLSLQTSCITQKYDAFSRIPCKSEQKKISSPIKCTIFSRFT